MAEGLTMVKAAPVEPNEGARPHEFAADLRAPHGLFRPIMRSKRRRVP